MILYGASMSPFVRKVLAFAAEKGIELEYKPVGIGDQSPDFREASPFGKLPALRVPGAGAGGGDFLLADSSAIVHYLDALKPEPNLIPTEPMARGRCIWWEEYADTLLMECGRRMFFNRVVAPMFMGQKGDLAAADRAEREQLPPLLAYLEGQVPDSGFLVEDRLTLADLAVASPFANLLFHMDVGLDETRYPRLLGYVRGMLDRPSLKKWVDKEVRFFAKVRGMAAA